MYKNILYFLQAQSGEWIKTLDADTLEYTTTSKMCDAQLFTQFESKILLGRPIKLLGLKVHFSEVKKSRSCKIARHLNKLKKRL